MTLNCPTWLAHRLGQLHAVQHGVVHLKWVKDPSASHARQFHTASNPLFRGGWEFLKISCIVGKLWRHRGRGGITYCPAVSTSVVSSVMYASGSSCVRGCILPH